jgi:hypothetical protein
MSWHAKCSLVAAVDLLRGLVGNVRLTAGEVDADLNTSGTYTARSLPTVSAASQST